MTRTTRPSASATSNAARRGIALVSVLFVLAAVLMLGVGSLVLTQSNLMVAQNLVGTSIAKGHADAGLDATVAMLFATYETGSSLPASLTTAALTVLPTGTMAYALATDGGYVLHANDEVTLRVVGTGPRDAEYVAEARVAFAREEAAAGGASPFDGVVIGCEGVTLNGSGRIDSFDSRNGPYNQGTAGNEAVVQTTDAGANVRNTGNAPIYGDVMATGGFTATGSSAVYGDIVASGDVSFQANAAYGGDVRTTGNVTFSNTAQVQGSVSANGNVTFGNGARVNGDSTSGGNIAFNNSGARVAGNARAAGSITRGHGDAAAVHVQGSSTQNAATVANAPVPTQACDPLGLPDVVAGFAGVPSSGSLQTGWPRNRWEIAPTGVRAYDETWNVKAWVPDASRTVHQVDVFGQTRSMIRTGDVNLGNGELRITGGDVVLFVDGNLTLGTGGGAGLIIDPGSTLTVFVTGRTQIGSSVQMTGISPVTGGAATFSLFSNYANTQTWGAKGVSIEANSRLTAAIYAPRAFVSVNAGGGMFGAARGKTVEVTGAGGIHFDEALLAVGLGGGGASTSAGDPTVSIRSRR